MAMKPEISVKNLLMQAFLTGWERSDKSISQDEYLQSAIRSSKCCRWNLKMSTPRRAWA